MYKYNVYYEGSWLHEDNGFETYDEAEEDAYIYMGSKTDCWDADGVEWDATEFHIQVEEE